MPILVVTRSELCKALFVVFFILGSFAAYPLLTPEETRDFSRVQKEFRVLALQDGKPFATTLATLPKGAAYLLPANSYELTPDLHKVVVLEKTAAWQLVEYQFDNTVSTVSRYRAFRDRIEPVSHRMTFHPGLPLVFALLVLPAGLFAFLGSLLWKAPPPPAAPAAPRRNAWTSIVAIARGVMRAISWARSAMQTRDKPPSHAPAVARIAEDQRAKEPVAAPARRRRSRLWIGIGTGAAVVVVGFLGLAIMLPAYCDYTSVAKVSEAILGLSAARTEIHEFYRKHGRVPKDVTEIDPATLRPGEYSRLREIRYEEGVVTGVLTKIEPRYEGKLLTLRAKPSADGLEWTCAVHGLPARDVPQMCRPTRVADSTGPLGRLASCGGPRRSVFN